MEEEEDDFYTQNGDAQPQNHQPNGDNPVQHDQDVDVEDGQDEDEDEDGDDDDDDSDSDIDIITERKDGAAPDPPPQARPFRGIKPEPPRTPSTDALPTQRSQQPPSVKTESSTQQKKVSLKDGSKYPEIRTSAIDVNDIPTWDSAGKLITQVDIDADLAEHTKPWRLPGTDQTDFFNYGFDEFTWTQYCLRQQNMASTINSQKAETKQFEMMLAGGMPGQPTPAGPQSQPPAAAMAMGMPGMPDMPPEAMATMMSYMQSQGIDPSQLDFGTFMQHMQQMGMSGMPGMPGQAGPGQGPYGGQSMQSQGSNQGYGGQQHGQSPFPQQGNQGFRGGTPQPGQQSQQNYAQQPQAQAQAGMNGFDGYSQQQIAMMQGQGGGIPSGPSGGGRGRGRGRRW